MFYLVVSCVELLNVRQRADICQTLINTSDQMKRITIRLPDRQVDLLQLLVEKGEFPNISEAVRGAVRELIERRVEYVIKDTDTDTINTFTIDTSTTDTF